MTITRIELERFTVFRHLEMKPSPGVNVLVGENGVGKTHLMKLAYAACDITTSKQDFADKLVSTFLPSKRRLGRLVFREQGSSSARVMVERETSRLQLGFSNHVTSSHSENIVREEDEESAWQQIETESVYIPVKEMLSNGPGFRSLYSRREVHFESVYNDVLERAYLPVLRGPHDAMRKELLRSLEHALEGKVIVKDEEFFLKNRHGELEFTLLAEGLRKLGLLWLLVQNGVLINGAVLFWDEPESNLNPMLLKPVIEVMLKLQQMGVQIFVSTHSYSVLKEFELAGKDEHQIRYFSLHRAEESGDVELSVADKPFMLEANPIVRAMTDLFDREVQRSLGGSP